MRAITSPFMPPAPPSNDQFKRQIVFRIGPDDWPLLETAAAEHGSIQSAVLAGLRALKNAEPQLSEESDATAEPAAPSAADDGGIESDEIRASEAARILGLKTSTVSRYIRTGRLPGRYNGSRWVTTRSAVAAYTKPRSMRG